MAQVDDKDLDRTAAIIRSMTPAERENPKMINGSRRLRIANGSGVKVNDVNQLVDRFFEARKMMGQMGGMIPGMRKRSATKSSKNKRKGKKGKKGGRGPTQPRMPAGFPGGFPGRHAAAVPPGQFPPGMDPDRPARPDQAQAPQAAVDLVQTRRSSAAGLHKIVAASRSSARSRFCWTAAANSPHPGRGVPNVAAARSNASGNASISRGPTRCTGPAPCRCSTNSTGQPARRRVPAGASTCTSFRSHPVRPSSSAAVNAVNRLRGPACSCATRRR